MMIELIDRVSGIGRRACFAGRSALFVPSF